MRNLTETNGMIPALFLEVSVRRPR